MGARVTKDVAGAVIGASLLAAAGAVARDGTVGSTEAAVFRAVNGLPDELAAVLWPFQQLGNLVVAPAVTVGVAALLRARQPAVAALLATPVKLGSERLVKRMVHRDRPAATVPGARRRGADVPATGQSFVSGHAALVTAMATVLAPHLPGRWRAVPWALAGSVVVARVYVGAHNPLDVMGGAGLGLAIGSLCDLVTLPLA